MKCEQAAEFISRLCDGQVIPPDAAEHIGLCETCRAQMTAYLAMGAELRRLASLEQPAELKPSSWAKQQNQQGLQRLFWQKGWQVVRIPRLIFAALVVAIVVLGSSLMMVKARAHTQGSVLMLTATPVDDKPIRCALSLEDKKAQSCVILTSAYGYDFSVLAVNEDRIELGIRAARVADFEAAPPNYSTSDDIKKLVEKPYWLQPGEKLNIPVAGSGAIVITGELIDHMPSWGADPNQLMDPKQGEIRFDSPVLVRGKQVLADFAGSSTSTDGERNHGIEVYAPSEGLFHISLSPLQGGTEGRVEGSRISFEMDGQSYAFLLGAPVTRADHVSILRDASYTPSNPHGQKGFIGSADESSLLANP